MILFPNAKINLGLYITSRRSDGFHNLETVFYPVPIYDVLEILPADRFSLHIYGNSIAGNPADNLCTKAWKMLHEFAQIPAVALHLLKHIPTGAGLGGGSADGAFALRGLAQMFCPSISTDTLMEMALKLGSDCPFFLLNKPAFATGRGELLTTLNLSLKGTYLMLLQPGIHVSTANAFAQIKPAPAPEHWIPVVIPEKPDDWCLVKNDFEPGASSRYPIIKRLIEALLEMGALYAAMSGTGSTVYGLFEHPPVALPSIKEFILWEGII